MNSNDSSRALGGAQAALPRMSLPGRSYLTLLVVLAVWSITIWIIVLEVLSWPCLGAEFSPNVAGASVRVTDLRAGAPAAAAGLELGDEITALTHGDGRTYRMTGFEAVEGRHQLHSYAMSNRAQAAKSATWDILEAGPVTFETREGKRGTITPEEGRALLSLPLAFFNLMLQSLIVVVIAAGILAFAPASLPVTLLVVSGFGMGVNMMLNMVATASELTMPDGIYMLTITLGPVAIMVFCLALLALLWYFPEPIGRFPFGLAVLAYGVFVSTAQHFQYFEFPIHPYQTPLLLTMCAGLAVSGLSWRRTRGKPLQRASVMWFVLSIIGVTAFVVVFYNLPVFFRMPPIIGTNVALFAVTFVYVGIALGTLRYRLFDIQRIWWRTITWAVGGLVVLLADVLLVAQFDFEQATALPLALLLAGWGYFPIRQVIFEYFVASRSVRVEHHVPELIRTFSGLDGPEEFDGRLVAFLRKVFQAEEIGRVRQERIAGATVAENGLALKLPDLSGARSIQIVGKASGRQLFSSDDAAVADSLVRLVRYLAEASQREFEELRKDRRRIVRDLHDDVGGRLLSMVYTAPTSRVAAEAREALAALKDALIVIEDTETIDVTMAWANLRDEAARRLADAGIALRVEEDFRSERVLSTREYMNLKRIVQEVASNIIKYAEPEAVTFAISVTPEGALRFRASNRIAQARDATSSTRRGLANIETRLAEIGGSITIETGRDGAARTYHIEVLLPFAE